MVTGRFCGCHSYMIFGTILLFDNSFYWWRFGLSQFAVHLSLSCCYWAAFLSTASGLVGLLALLSAQNLFANRHPRCWSLLLEILPHGFERILHMNHCQQSFFSLVILALSTTRFLSWQCGYAVVALGSRIFNSSRPFLAGSVFRTRMFTCLPRHFFSFAGRTPLSTRRPVSSPLCFSYIDGTWRRSPNMGGRFSPSRYTKLIFHPVSSLQFFAFS